MDYRVVITPEAQDAIERDLEFLRRGAQIEVVDRWFAGLMTAIASLAHLPTRCGVISESRVLGEELRQILYGRRRHRRRVIFIIDGDVVRVVHYRHCSLPRLDAPDHTP